MPTIKKSNIFNYIKSKFNNTSSDIKMNGTQSAGSVDRIARADHVHPVDTSRAAASHTHTKANITDFPSTMTPSSHSHGDISNDGKLGSTANKPIITTTGGKLTTGSFGNAANTFCEGNDSRLSDARTPTSHAHGNVTNDGKIGNESGKPIITTTGGAVTTGAFGTSSGTFAEGNHTHNDGYSFSFLAGDNSNGISLTKINGIAIVTMNNYYKSYSATGWQEVISTGLTNRTGNYIYATNADTRFRITAQGKLQMHIDTTGTVYTGWAQIVFPYS